MHYQEIPTDWAAKWSVYSPNKTAFKEFETGRTLTYAELEAVGNGLAHWLTEKRGLKAGDRIAFLAENCLEYVLFFVAAQKTGIILVPLNYRLSAPEVTYLLQNCDPALLIVEEQFAAKVEEEGWRKGHADRLLTLENIQDVWPVWREGGFEPVTTRRDADETLFILYTSGSTGFPKGVKYTHGMLFWNSVNTGFSVKVNTDSRTVTCMPLFHTGGWNVLLTPFFHHGGYTCLMKRFDAELVLRSLDAERVTIFMGVPTMLKMMSEAPWFERASLETVHYFLVGGEAMPIPQIELWNGKGVPIRQGYGMTECGPNLTSLHHDDAISQAGSIGRPNFFIQTRIVDPSGADCPQGTPGELLIRGPIVTPGYWNNEEATQKAIVDGWMHTGDRVVEQPGGYLYVVDRIKNMFISGGENVYPAEIERVLQGHPQVSEVVVIGVPDPKWGEVGKACLVLREGAVFDRDGFAQYCGQRLARFKIPKHFEVMAALPKGDTGKIDRKVLKEQFLQASQ